MNRRDRQFNRLFAGRLVTAGPALQAMLGPNLLGFDLVKGDATIFSPSSLGGANGIDPRALQGGFSDAFGAKSG